MKAWIPRVGDLAKAPALGWSIRKMEAALAGFAAAWASYFVFTYLALLAGPARNGGISALFRHFEFFPWLYPGEAGAVSLILWIAGIVIAVCAVLNAALAVSSVAAEDIRGNDSFMVSDAFRFARRNRGMLLVSVGALAGIALVFAAGFAIWGLIARIPYAGELLIGLKAIFLVAWGVLGAAALLTFVLGLFTVPAIIACGAGDALETVIEAYLFMWTRPIRFLLLQIAARLISVASGALLGLLVLAAFVIAGTAASFTGGIKISELFTVAAYRVPFLMECDSLIRAIQGLSSFVGTPFLTGTAEASWSILASGWMIGVSFLLAGAWVASYSFSVFWSAQTLNYLILRGRIDRNCALPEIEGRDTTEPVVEKHEPSTPDGM